jgi:hypothetical protein
LVNEQEQHFMSTRDQYINSIGNYRVWPNWLNQSDKDRCHSEKLGFVGGNEGPKELGLNNAADLMQASAIALQDRKLWEASGGKRLQWPEVRRKAWQEAVERRVEMLYQELLTTLQFQDWLAVSPSAGTP